MSGSLRGVSERGHPRWAIEYAETSLQGYTVCGKKQTEIVQHPFVLSLLRNIYSASQNDYIHIFLKASNVHHDYQSAILQF